MKKLELFPVISFVIGMVLASAYAFFSERMEEIPFISAIGGAAAGLIYGLFIAITEYKETGEGESFWMLIVSPLLFLLPAYLLGLLFLFLNSLFSGGFP